MKKCDFFDSKAMLTSLIALELKISLNTYVLSLAKVRITVALWVQPIIEKWFNSNIILLLTIVH